MDSPHTGEEDPGLDGPDYLALVIEWGEDDEATIVRDRPKPVSSLARDIAGVVAALLAIGAATWGLRRLRA